MNGDDLTKEELLARLLQMEERIDELEEKLDQKDERIKEQNERIEELEARLRKYENPHTPPSKRRLASRSPDLARRHRWRATRPGNSVLEAEADGGLAGLVDDGVGDGDRAADADGQGDAVAGARVANGVVGVGAAGDGLRGDKDDRQGGAFIRLTVMCRSLLTACVM